MIYDSELEANTAYDKAEKELSNKICPMLISRCNKLCISYYAGSKLKRVARTVHNPEGKDSWLVYTPCCMNTLLTGEVVVSQ